MHNTVLEFVAIKVKATKISVVISMQYVCL